VVTLRQNHAGSPARGARHRSCAASNHERGAAQRGRDSAPHSRSAPYSSRRIDADISAYRSRDAGLQTSGCARRCTRAAGSLSPPPLRSPGRTSPYLQSFAVHRSDSDAPQGARTLRVSRALTLSVRTKRNASRIVAGQIRITRRKSAFSTCSSISYGDTGSAYSSAGGVPGASEVSVPLAKSYRRDQKHPIS